MSGKMEGNDPFEKSQTVHPEVRAYVYSLVNAVSSALHLVRVETNGV